MSKEVAKGRYLFKPYSRSRHGKGFLVYLAKHKTYLLGLIIREHGFRRWSFVVDSGETMNVHTVKGRGSRDFAAQALENYRKRRAADLQEALDKVDRGIDKVTLIGFGEPVDA